MFNDTIRLLLEIENNKIDTIFLSRTKNENLFYYSRAYRLVNKEGFSKPQNWSFFKILGYNNEGKVIEQYERLNYYSDWENGGEYHGNVTIKDSAGNIKEISNYINGKLNGVQIEYYSNGVIRDIKSWKKGVPEGIWRFYNEKGILIEIKKYKKGKLKKNKA